jgi:hypothetical protein
MKKKFNEGNQIHNFMSSSGSRTVINYGSGSGSDFLTSNGSGYGSGSTSQKVTVPTVPVPVPQHCVNLLLSRAFLQNIYQVPGTLCQEGRRRFGILGRLAKVGIVKFLTDRRC